MKCIEIKKDYISVDSAKSLIKEDEVFVIDMDAFTSGSFNLAEYTYLSNFFDITVMNGSSRVNDLVDSLIAGAMNVVISGEVKEKVLRSFLDLTENIVLPYSDEDSALHFVEMGGKYFLSDSPVPVKANRIYYYGTGDPGGNYVKLDNFPDNIGKQAGRSGMV
ncbi:MAG: hypothetical protein ACP5UV_00270 [Thermoplasmata archaeon]